MQFEHIVDVHLEQGRLAEVELGPTLYEEDSNGLKLGVRLWRNGEAVAVTGTVSGWAIVSTGQTISPFDDTGSEDNLAWVLVPQGALIPGRIEIFLRITGDSDSAVTLHATGTVRRTKTSEIIVPGDPLPDVDQLRQIAQRCEDAAEAAEELTTNAVQYTAQTKSEAEQAVARGNIGAVSLGEITSERQTFDTPIALEGYYVRHSDGTRTSNSSYNATERINISGCQRILYKRTGTTAGTSTAGMAFYDANGDYVSGISAATRQAHSSYVDDLYEAEVPDNAVYAAFTTFADTTQQGQFALYGVYLSGVESLAEFTQTGVVRYDNEQTLTDEQKAQARTNIGAENASAVRVIPKTVGYIAADATAETVEVDENGVPVNAGSSATSVRYIVLPCSPGDRITARSPSQISNNTRNWMMLGAVDTSTTPNTRPILAKHKNAATPTVFTAPAGTELVVFASTTSRIANDTDRYWMGGMTEARLDALEVQQETVSGSSVTITAESNHRYLCGTLDSLSFTPCSSGLCEVVFTAGSDMVLSLSSTVRMPDWWTGVEAGRTYDLMILDGVYGAVMSWA